MGTQTTKLNLAPHKGRCSNGTLYCTHYQNFSTTTHAGLNYHSAKKHPIVRAKNNRKSNVFLEKFSGVYALRKHSSSQYGIATKTSGQDMDILLEDIDEVELNEKLNSYNYLLVDCEIGKSRLRSFYFAISSLNNSFLNEIYLFSQLKCAGSINLAFGFVLKNLTKERVDTFRHTKTTLETKKIMKKTKLVWTGKDLTKLKKKCQEWILLITAQEEERTLSGNFTNLEMLHFLLRYSKIHPWVVKTLFYQSPFWTATWWIILLLREYETTLQWQPLLF